MNVLNTNIMSFYHPTKVVFLDDSQAFLDAVALELYEQENLLMFTNPDSAMEQCKNSNESIFQFTAMEKENNNLDLNGNSITTTFNMVNMIYEPSRFNNVAVLVVDYSMPKINGIEFCKQLRDRNIYKILLTAEADSDIAINAFNDGIIDKFILKTHANLFEQLKIYINELTNKYFINFSRDSLNYGGGSLKSLLNNDSFKDLFNKIIKQNAAIEYYLIDRLGSFLFLTRDGKSTWLLISDQDKINSQVDLLKDYSFPDELIKKIKEKENILFLFSENEYKEDLVEWKKYIFESQKLDDNYNFSIVVGNLTNSIDWDKVVSYQ
ncbi:TPA: response regulator [Legionella pneumophila]